MQTHDIRRVAVEASCDIRTVRRYLDGKAKKGGLVAERISNAIDKLGLPQPSSAPSNANGKRETEARRSA